MNYDALTATGGEKECAPQPGVKAGKGTNWEERHYKPGGYAVGVCGFTPCPFSYTYAFVYLYCDRPYENVQMLTGSDDGLLAILNGQIVQRVRCSAATPPTRTGRWWRCGRAGTGCFARWTIIPAATACACGSRRPTASFSRTTRSASFGPRKGARCGSSTAWPTRPMPVRLLKEAMKASAEKGDMAAAAAKCGEVIAKYPKAQAAAEAMYQAGSFQAKAGKIDLATKTYTDLLGRYPYSKWAEDTLIAQAEILISRKDPAAAEKLLAKLVADHPEASLASEAMLRLAALQTGRGDRDAADLTLGEVRRKFPLTVEAVKALEGLADNQQVRGKTEQAAKLYQQVIDEAQRLSGGKYVFFVNVQAVLAKISDSARSKLEAEPKRGK